MDVRGIERELEAARKAAEADLRVAETAAARARMSRQRLELLEQLLETELALGQASARSRSADKPASPERDAVQDRDDSSPRETVSLTSLLSSDQRRPSRKRGQAAVLIEAAKAALGKVHRPLHIAELRASIEKAGIPIPGQGEDANLIVHLRKSEDIVRVGKGFYALAEWGLQPVSKPTTRARKRARR